MHGARNLPLLAAVALIGCGTTTPDRAAAPARTVTVTETVVTSTSRAATTPRAASPFKRCDANIRARRGSTTCAFAQNVFYAFWRATDRGDDVVSAYSRASGSTYDLDCAAGDTVVCTAGDGAEIRFPMAAIDAYDREQAAAYCATHDVTGAGVGVGCEEEPEPEPAPTDDCDPNYEGACLDPYSPDYDCEGGSGDGPDYTGEVYVVGDDPHDLDRDGNGVGCE